MKNGKTSGQHDPKHEGGAYHQLLKRLLIGCVHTATKPTIPLIGMTGWSMKLSLLPYLPMNCMSGK